MTDKMKEYAEFHGIEEKPAGEIVLTAASGGEIIRATAYVGVEIHHVPSSDLLEAVGILSSDSKESVITKIRAAVAAGGIHDPEGHLPIVEDIVEEEKMDLHGLSTEEIFGLMERSELQSVLEWMGVEDGSAKNS